MSEGKKIEKKATSPKRRKSFFWNMIGGCISSSQSVIILFFAARYLETEAVGVFTIGYAMAVLGCTLAKYGIRTYQVTDIKEKFNRCEYVYARILTVIGTLLVILVHVTYMYINGHYGLEKGVIIILICCWKLIEAFEDVLIGIYQQLHQLDAGAYLFSLRIGLSTILYCGLIALTSSLLVTTVISVVVSILMSGICFGIGNRRNGIKLGEGKLKHSFDILLICLPLFVANSVNIFVGNEPKYLVDSILNDTAQAYLGYIITPAYVIGLLSGFVYQPQIRDYGELWDAGMNEELKQRIFKQSIFTIAVVGILCIWGGLIGIPVLSWFYATDLRGLEKEFIVLILGGGAFALTTFMMIVLSVLREQRFMAGAYIMVAIISLIAGRVMVAKWHIFGAAILFLMINMILLVAFATKVIVLFYRKEKE